MIENSMNYKEKIILLEKFIRHKGKSPLPLELESEVTLQANILQISKVGGALIYMRELQREETQKDIIKIQEKQTEFSKILMLATVVLALGTFLNLILKTIEFDLSIITSSVGYGLASLFIFLFLIFLSIMGFSIWFMFNHFIKNR